VSGSADLPERIEKAWAGFNGDGPVRVGNEAAAQVQHDVFGELVLTLAPVFHDERFRAERTSTTLELIFKLADRAIEVAGTPDRGIWEVRSEPTPQTFSNLMCWAAADRAAAIASSIPAKANTYRVASATIRDTIMQRAWNETRGSYVGSYDSDNLDASLLQMAPLRLFPSDDPRLRKTVDAIWRGLTHNGWLMRYRQDDGLGEPTVAFVLCTFWLIEALELVGRRDDARVVMDRTCSIQSPLGLIAEDYDMATNRMSGNFPQAYSHVGLIRAAFAASPRWRDVL
jgi:GH15 family glucan-1,4-alpha-glucosidase